MARVIGCVLVALALVAAVCATPGTPGCFNNQASFNWNYVEFHDINLAPLDIVLGNSDVAINFETQQLMIEGDFIQNTTTYIGAIYVNGTNVWVMIHGTCTFVSNNVTGIFASQCVQNQTQARQSTMGNDTVYIFQENLEFPGLDVIRRTFTYWTDVPNSQPVAWQSMFLTPMGDEVGTSSWIADGYKPTADPAKLAVPAACLNTKTPRYADLRAAVHDEPRFRIVQSLLMNL